MKNTLQFAPIENTQAQMLHWSNVEEEEGDFLSGKTSEFSSDITLEEDEE